MLSLIFTWILNALAIFGAAYLLPGIQLEGFMAALILALVLGIINTLIKPIIWLLTLPINLITLGLFSLVINALMVMLADHWVTGFSASNFWWALLFSCVVSVFSTLLNSIFNSSKKQQ